MAFNSIPYLLFFLSVFVFYHVLPRHFRPILILCASYFFYAERNLAYLFLIVSTTLITFCIAFGIEQTGRVSTKKAGLATGITLILLTLLYFKYSRFFCDILNHLMRISHINYHEPDFGILLPVGISFFTFQCISYLIDVYRGRIVPERNILYFSLYVSFFPQVLAGPIARAPDLIPQMKNPQALTPERISMGMVLILWGLFKKTVIADRLGLYVDSVFNNIPFHNGPSFLMATYFYSIQIYCDFSGYTDIARGCACLLGVDLMRNFNLPYFSLSIRDFWRRWHISLSSWFRDYVYIPLGGNRLGAKRMYLNLLFVMTLCGLWHGAAWTFVVWGTLHGLCLCLFQATQPLRARCLLPWALPRSVMTGVQILFTFHLVTFLWIFFRARNIQDALYVITHLFSGWPHLYIQFGVMSLGFFGIAVLALVEWLQSLGLLKKSIQDYTLISRWAVYYAIIFLIILLGVDGGAQFIYFQF